MTDKTRTMWTAEDDALLAALTAAGRSDAQIAELMGQTEFSVFRRRRIKRIRLNKDRKAPKAWTAEELELLSELYSTGEYTMAALAERFGCSISNVQRRLKNNRINCRWTDELIEQCIELRQSGMTYVEIAKIVGGSSSSINTRLTRRYPELIRNKNTCPTLCWNCQNARAGYCSWFTDFTPVPGWEAEETVLESTTSYAVKKCPNFIRDEERSCAWSKST